MRRKSWGFTLIELMITVAIVGILASVAYPSYKNHIKKGARAAAESQILDIANREQQYLLANRSFATHTTLIANGYTMPTDVSSNYTWAVEVSNTASAPPSYTITFTPVTTKVMAGDGDLTYNSSGTKSSNW